MKRNLKKLVAPVIITVLLILYYAALALVFALVPEIPLWLRFVMGIPPLALCGVAVYVLVQRIREIRGGEEDDLDRY